MSTFSSYFSKCRAMSSCMNFLTIWSSFIIDFVRLFRLGSRKFFRTAVEKRMVAALNFVLASPAANLVCYSYILLYSIFFLLFLLSKIPTTIRSHIFSLFISGAT
jgi:hypothetical protein